MATTRIYFAHHKPRKQVHFILTVIWGGSPLRPEMRMEPRAGLDGLEQPQCVSRAKLKRRGRNLLHSMIPAVVATMLNAMISCQFTLQTYAVSSQAQLVFWGPESEANGPK